MHPIRSIVIGRLVKGPFWDPVQYQEILKLGPNYDIDMRQLHWYDLAPDLYFVCAILGL